MGGNLISIDKPELLDWSLRTDAHNDHFSFSHFLSDNLSTGIHQQTNPLTFTSTSWRHDLLENIKTTEAAEIMAIPAFLPKPNISQ